MLVLYAANGWSNVARARISRSDAMRSYEKVIPEYRQEARAHFPIGALRACDIDGKLAHLKA